MEIRIDKKGNNQGTIGWLANGIESGKIKLSEGTLKTNGNHGLWLNGPDGFTQFLGAFNQYNHDGRCNYNPFRYRPAIDDDREGIWTDAAWDVLMEIASGWCDEMNDATENEEKPEFTIHRVAVETA